MGRDVYTKLRHPLHEICSILYDLKVAKLIRNFETQAKILNREENVKQKENFFHLANKEPTCNSLSIQSVTNRCGQIMGTSSTYQNKKEVHISMCSETFNLTVTAERILHIHDGALAHFSRAV
jgi:hypothetical protein